jgi:hypothetical protein
MSTHIYTTEMKQILELLEFLSEKFSSGSLVMPDSIVMIDSNGDVCGSIGFTEGAYCFKTSKEN